MTDVYVAVDQIVLDKHFAASHVCDVLDVSRSGFFARRRSSLSLREAKDQELTPIVLEILWTFPSHRDLPEEALTTLDLQGLGHYGCVS